MLSESFARLAIGVFVCISCTSCLNDVVVDDGEQSYGESIGASEGAFLQADESQFREFDFEQGAHTEGGHITYGARGGETLSVAFVPGDRGLIRDLGAGMTLDDVDASVELSLGNAEAIALVDHVYVVRVLRDSADVRVKLLVTSVDPASVWFDWAPLE